MLEQELKRKVIEIGRALVTKGLVLGTGGNISIRTEKGFLVTPSGMDYFMLRPGDLVALDLECRVLDGDRKPSIEKNLHAAILAARPDVRAVIHTHSECCTAVAACRKALPAATDNQVAYFGGEVPVADYAPIGTETLAKNAARALGDGCAVLLANHGAVCVGATLEEAFLRCEMLESFSRIFIYAQMAGGCVAIEKEDARREYLDLKERYGQRG
ncbi:class II aldolase/adducin family protein [Synergistaceae bacterium OttesenSCG-928-D05]|nr:class II aldolase/adducin family protein [Synergistaceae bacterium OttesenSCG-928-D05]